FYVALDLGGRERATVDADLVEGADEVVPADALTDGGVDARGDDLRGRHGTAQGAVVEHAVDIAVEGLGGGVVNARHVIPGVIREDGLAVALRTRAGRARDSDTEGPRARVR